MVDSLEDIVESNESQDFLEEHPASVDIEVEEEEEKSEKPKRLGSYWRRPATKVYADNFGFSVNGYQPMIDYLDTKDSGGSANKSDVHLPYLEERCMNKYSSKKPFRYYDNSDIDQYITKGEKIRTQIRQNDAAGASNVLRRTHTNWSMTRKYVQLVKNSYVCDYRKLHSSDDYQIAKPKKFHTAFVPKITKYNLDPLLPYCILFDMDTSGNLASYIRAKLDHDNDMAARRERLRIIDDQYEDSIKKLSRTVDRMGHRVDNPTRVIMPSGSIYTVNDLTNQTDDMVFTNRMKRQQDLYRLNANVDSLLAETSSSRRRYQRDGDYLRDETVGVNATARAIASRNATAALLARQSIPKTMASSLGLDDEDQTYDKFRPRSVPPEDVFEPKIRRSRVHDDVVSDVQTRILARAREMGGVSSEERKIKHRARFVNTVSPRPNTGDTELIVPPTRTERNIVHMSKYFAYSGNPNRRYDVDDEVDAPVSNLNTHSVRRYCNREFEKPIPEVLSNYERVNEAKRTARIRNTLLGN